MLRSPVRNLVFFFSCIALLSFAAGCKKKVATTPPAQTPAPTPSPTVNLSASPTSVHAGDTVTLSWSSTNATDLTIDNGVGKVATQGSTPVNPQSSTTYTITATGPGGSATATASVSVSAPVAAAPQPSAGPSLSELFEQNVKDAFFDFNKSDIRDDAREALTKDAEFFRSYPDIRVTIEGHCDERGSTEYNIGLGERRAQAAKNYLVSLGISASRIDTVSWGKEHPFCTQHDEACWQQNRRAHFVYAH